MKPIDFLNEAAKTDREILDIIEDYSVDQNGTINTPGKFEGEPIYAPVAWNWYLNGSSDVDLSDGTLAWEIDQDMVDTFPMLADHLGHWLCAYESEQGFIHTCIRETEPTEDEENDEGEDD